MLKCNNNESSRWNGKAATNTSNSSMQFLSYRKGERARIRLYESRPNYFYIRKEVAELEVDRGSHTPNYANHGSLTILSILDDYLKEENITSFDYFLHYHLKSPFTLKNWWKHWNDDQTTIDLEHEFSKENFQSIEWLYSKLNTIYHKKKHFQRIYLSPNSVYYTSPLVGYSGYSCYLSLMNAPNSKIVYDQLVHMINIHEHQKYHNHPIQQTSKMNSTVSKLKNKNVIHVPPCIEYRHMKIQKARSDNLYRPVYVMKDTPSPLNSMKGQEMRNYSTSSSSTTSSSTTATISGSSTKTSKKISKPFNGRCHNDKTIISHQCQLLNNYELISFEMLSVVRFEILMLLYKLFLFICTIITLYKTNNIKRYAVKTEGFFNFWKEVILIYIDFEMINTRLIFLFFIYTTIPFFYATTMKYNEFIKSYTINYKEKVKNNESKSFFDISKLTSKYRNQLCFLLQQMSVTVPLIHLFGCSFLFVKSDELHLIFWLYFPLIIFLLFFHNTLINLNLSERRYSIFYRLFSKTYYLILLIIIDKLSKIFSYITSILSDDASNKIRSSVKEYKIFSEKHDRQFQESDGNDFIFTINSKIVSTMNSVYLDNLTIDQFYEIQKENSNIMTDHAVLYDLFTIIRRERLSSDQCHKHNFLSKDCLFGNFEKMRNNCPTCLESWKMFQKHSTMKENLKKRKNHNVHHMKFVDYFMRKSINYSKIRIMINNHYKSLNESKTVRMRNEVFDFVGSNIHYMPIHTCQQTTTHTRRTAKFLYADVISKFNHIISQSIFHIYYFIILPYLCNSSNNYSDVGDIFYLATLHFSISIVLHFYHLFPIRYLIVLMKNCAHLGEWQLLNNFSHASTNINDWDASFIYTSGTVVKYFQEYYQVSSETVTAHPKNQNRFYHKLFSKPSRLLFFMLFLTIIIYLAIFIHIFFAPSITNTVICLISSIPLNFMLFFYVRNGLIFYAIEKQSSKI
ncbi:hypothetical protein SNEBB_008865 [Seison nebaliae]|nr:hypothetical protein SNEBB_008865 [Seison nebaliae]